MAHVLFGDTDDWKLDDENQDIRGWEVRDANGAPVGRVGGMAVDTERKVVDTIILEDGSRFLADDVTLSDGVVYVTTYGAPAGVATRPYTGSHGVRRIGDPPPSGEVRSAADAGRRPAFVDDPSPVSHEAAGRGTGTSGYAAAEDDFRAHYRDAYGDDGLAFDDYSPAYRYGFDAAYDDRYGERSYEDAEPDLREGFYRRFGYPMSDNIVWSRVRGAVRHAYERARAAAR